MKVNLKPTLTVLAAAISCVLPLVAGATDQAATDTHYSRNFQPVVERVRQAVLGLPKSELAKYGAILKTPCVTGPEFGAMGVHLINAENVDGVVNVDKPEALIYEPQANGKLRIVGVEYIVPFTDIPSTANPPTLLGQSFAQVPEFGVWGLHIWVGRHNPSGIFTAWNPKVSCANAPASQQARMTHHHGN